MFPAQRIEMIKNILRQQKSADISTLTSMLGVSNVTIRKYLDQLEEEGFLTKVHGGAILAETNETSDSSETDIFDQTNRQIADLAAQLIEDNETVFLGPGNACCHLASCLLEKKNITIVTNSIPAAEILGPYIDNIFFLGGKIVHNSDAFFTIGPTLIQELENIFVSKAFFTPSGIDSFAGITIDNPLLLPLYQTLDKISKQTVILADASHFDKIALNRLSEITHYSTYVTGSDVSEDYKTFFFNHNIKLLTAYDISI